MSSLTITSHEFEANPNVQSPVHLPAERPRELTRRFRETFAGWPQMWAIWQDVPMTPWGYPMSAAPFARGATGTPTDRLGGRDIPLMWNEVDLRGFRVLSKFLCDTNPFAIGILGMLKNYHIRKGYGWQACRTGAKKTAYPTADTEDDLVRRGQMILDTFRNRVKWGKMSREAFKHYCRDGEVFVLFGGNGYGKLPWCRFIHSDQIGNPSGSTTTPQSFGIETAPHDVLDRWAYHVWDEVDYPSGGEWIEASRIVHAKKNVDWDVKRGLPDFFPIQDNLDTVRKLLTNMIGTAAAQAAIAWREKYPTATVQQIQGMIPQRSDDSNCPPGSALPEWWRRNQLDPATVLKVEGNREFEQAMTTPTADFIEAEQACLRAAAVRVGFPESIITGKIDDVNFAASLTTNAPMAVCVEGTQYEWGEDFERECALKVLDYAAEAGLISRTERQQLDVEVTEPTIITPEPDKESTRRKTMFDARVLSPQTWQLMEQLDPQHESENWAEWDLQNPPPVPIAGVAKGGAASVKAQPASGQAKEDWDPEKHPRGQPDNAGKFGPGGSSGAKKKTVTEPPAGKQAYLPDLAKPNESTGLVDHARVGVPAMEVPYKDIPRLPNLSEKQRKVETRFADAYLADPDGLAEKYLKALHKGKVGVAPNVFATDDVKMLNPDWNPGKARAGEALDKETQKAMAKNNTAVHQTANAIAKRAFLKYLDQLPDDKRTVLVTNGGCAAGKGSSLARADDPDSPYAKMLPAASRVGAVWDAAGEQNATENEWVLQECKKRGIVPTFAYFYADPKETWEAPDRGVIRRAMRKGRMVDARLFADSYAHGAKNMHAFHQKHKGDGTKFIFVDNRRKGEPKVMSGVPEDALKWDAEAIRKDAVASLNKHRNDLPKALVKGGLAGETIWGNAA